MATAVENPKTTPASATNTSPLKSGAIGAALILAAFVFSCYAVPQFWNSTITPILAPISGMVNAVLKVVAQLGIVAAVVAFGSILMGVNPPKGTRGAIGLIISMVLAIVFIVRAVGLNFEPPAGPIVTLVTAGALLGLAYRYLNSQSARRTMILIEEQGVFSLFSYKPNQGLKARRFTLIGLLGIAWAGIYSMTQQTVLPDVWNLDIPYTTFVLNLLTDLSTSVPLLLVLGSFWLAWRVVNMPAFADFLIATEAEMYKVSWSSRKRLIQDTIVVLVFVILMTLFLMVVDFFWGWVLSLKPVGVLPERQKQQTNELIDPVQGRQVKW
jgi:preprotein translocase SecE subunit